MRKQNLNGKNTGDPLGEKSFNMALRIVNLYKFLTNDKKEYVLSRQILRSGTNPGAMVREAKHAESNADWIHKLSIAQKETNETIYWLELLHASNYLTKDEFSSIQSDVNEVHRILTSIILTKKQILKK